MENINKQYANYKKNREKASIEYLTLDKKRNNYSPIIIIPFRDDKKQNRSKQLNKISEYFKQYFTDTEYELIIIEQSEDNRKFNRGALLNIGAKIAIDKGFTYAIFHDVDLKPSDELKKYYCSFPYNPLHLGYNWKEKYDFSTFLGGVISINFYHLYKINGFPNNFWGWGGEDDAMYNRIVKNNIIINRPTDGNYTEMKECNNSISSENANLQKKKNILEDLDNWKISGLNSVDYHLIKYNNLSNYQKYTVYIKEKNPERFNKIENIPKIRVFDKLDECNNNRKIPIVKYLLDYIISKNQSRYYLRALRLKYILENFKAKKENNKKNLYEANTQILEYLNEIKNINFYQFERNQKGYNKAFHYGFKYLYNHIFKGVYIKIQNNEIKIFRPFINTNPKNDWSKYLKFTTNKTLNDKGVNQNIEHWMANNCLLDNKTPFDKKPKKLRDMIGFMYPTRLMEILFLIQKTLENNKIKDCEFFYNKKDFPIVRKDLKNPFITLYPNKELVSNYSKDYPYLLPILGHTGTKENADIMIPTNEDIDMVFKKYYPTTCENMYINEKTDKISFEDKIPTAVFRGKATGCGVSIETNPRLKIAYLNHLWKNDNKFNQFNNIDGYSFLNAGITGWNRRDKVNNGIVKRINPSEFSFDKIDYLSREEQLKYKYLITIDGHVRPFRLPFELGTNSLVLLVESKNDYKCWWSNLIKPYEHYVPINSDLSNLAEQIEWCKKNPKKCKDIVNKSTKWYNTYMTKKGLTDYMAFIFNNLL